MNLRTRMLIFPELRFLNLAVNILWRYSTRNALCRLRILHAQLQRKMNVSANLTATTAGTQPTEVAAIENDAVAKQPAEAEDVKAVESGDESDHAEDLMSQLPNCSMLTAHDSDAETQNQDVSLLHMIQRLVEVLSWTGIQL